MVLEWHLISLFLVVVQIPAFFQNGREVNVLFWNDRSATTLLQNGHGHEQKVRRGKTGEEGWTKEKRSTR